MSGVSASIDSSSLTWNLVEARLRAPKNSSPEMTCSNSSKDSEAFRAGSSVKGDGNSTVPVISSVEPGREGLAGWFSAGA